MYLPLNEQKSVGLSQLARYSKQMLANEGRNTAIIGVGDGVGIGVAGVRVGVGIAVDGVGAGVALQPVALVT